MYSCCGVEHPYGEGGCGCHCNFGQMGSESWHVRELDGEEEIESEDDSEKETETEIAGRIGVVIEGVGS